MIQTILPHLISETDIDRLMIACNSSTFLTAQEHLTTWKTVSTGVNSSISENTQRILAEITQLLNNEYQLEIQVEKLVRGRIKEPQPLDITTYSTDNTAYILFISTENQTYRSFPKFFNVDTLTDTLTLPLTLSKGDAVLIKYTTDLKWATVYSDTMKYFCAFYFSAVETPKVTLYVEEPVE